MPHIPIFDVEIDIGNRIGFKEGDYHIGFYAGSYVRTYMGHSIVNSTPILSSEFRFA